MVLSKAAIAAAAAAVAFPQLQLRPALSNQLEDDEDEDEQVQQQLQQRQIKKLKQHHLPVPSLASPSSPASLEPPLLPATPSEYTDSPTLAPGPVLVPVASSFSSLVASSSSTSSPSSPSATSVASASIDFHTTRSYPMNRGGYRYTACGPSLPSLSTLPTPLYRTIPCAPSSVHFAWGDRSPFVLITEDARTVMAEKGWRAARANVSMREGGWYWEVKIRRGGGEGGRDKGKGGEGEGSWVRVGVGRRESSISAPAGIDGHSYAYKDRTGDCVTLSRPTPYGKPFGTSSTIGIYLSLPTRPAPSTTDQRDPTRIVRKRVPIRYKGQLYFESREYAASMEMGLINEDPANRPKGSADEDDGGAGAEGAVNGSTAKGKGKAAPGTKSRATLLDAKPRPRILPKLEGSKIAFFVDGVCQGVAFEDVYDFAPLRLPDGWLPPKVSSSEKLLEVMENYNDDGTLGYYPLVSVFGGGTATLNPGPIFDFPPPSDIEQALIESPRPPKAGSNEVTTAKTAPKKTAKKDERRWRPLCDRYDEYYAEQAKLDDMDELEALRAFSLAQSQSQLQHDQPCQSAPAPSATNGNVSSSSSNGNSNAHPGSSSKRSKSTSKDDKASKAATPASFTFARSPLFTAAVLSPHLSYQEVAESSPAASADSSTSALPSPTTSSSSSSRKRRNDSMDAATMEAQPLLIDSSMAD